MYEQSVMGSETRAVTDRVTKQIVTIFSKTCYNILIHVAPIFDTIMQSVFTRRTKNMLNKLISFTVTKILAAVTKYLIKIMILTLCLYG